MKQYRLIFLVSTSLLFGGLSACGSGSDNATDTNNSQNNGSNTDNTPEAGLYNTAPETQWITSYAGSAEESHGHFILSCQDGGFLQVGETGLLTENPSTSSTQILAIKTDAQGNLLWKKQFADNSNGHNLGNTALEVEDGYLIAGALGEDSALIKLEKSTGNTLFEQRYDQGGNDAIEHLAETDDGYLLVGYHHAQDRGNTFFTEGQGLLFSVDKLGHQTTTAAAINLNTYMAQGYRIKAHNDHYIIAGLSEEAEDYALIKLQVNPLQVEWSNTYGGAKPDHLFALDVADDGSIFTTGHTLSDTLNWDTYTLKIDSNGNQLWQSKVGNPRGYDPRYIHDEAWGIKATADGGAITVAGTGDEYAQYSQCNNAPSDCSDVWRVYLVKHDSNGSVQWQQTYHGPSGLDWAGEDIDLTQDGGIIIAVDNGEMGFLKLYTP